MFGKHLLCTLGSLLHSSGTSKHGLYTLGAFSAKLGTLGFFKFTRHFESTASATWDLFQIDFPDKILKAQRAPSLVKTTVCALWPFVSSVYACWGLPNHKHVFQFWENLGTIYDTQMSESLSADFEMIRSSYRDETFKITSSKIFLALPILMQLYQNPACLIL